ncbi:hypothetical protein HUC16_19445 [Escherichia coli]|nr:hypothetical protein [Escherichia coli]
MGRNDLLIRTFLSTVNTNTGNYSGSQFYLGYMDDYGALRMTTLNCSGQCHLQAVEAKK